MYIPICICSLGMYFPLEGDVEQKSDLTSGKEGSDVLVMHWEVIIAKMLKLLETTILSLGLTIMSNWLLGTDTTPGRQRELVLTSSDTKDSGENWGTVLTAFTITAAVLIAGKHNRRKNQKSWVCFCVENKASRLARYLLIVYLGL